MEGENTTTRFVSKSHVNYNDTSITRNGNILSKSSSFAESQHNYETLALVVETSKILPTHSIIIVTKDGLTFGRDLSFNQLVVQLKELITSKCHANIAFKSKFDLPLLTINNRYNKSSYFYVTDYGSVHGTFINNTRLSAAKSTSKPHVLNNMDRLSIGSTTFVVHYHPECDACKIGPTNKLKLIEPVCKNITTKPDSLKAEEQLNRSQVIKKLKSIYKISDKPKVQDNYFDRASNRRKLNSEDVSNIEEVYLSKPENSSFVKSGIGKKLLVNMGWKEGSGIGKELNGIVEPISMKNNDTKRGIGLSTKGGKRKRR